MNCKDFHEFIDSYLGDELLTETNHDMISHMEDCPECRSVIEVRREFRTRLRSAVASCDRFALPEGFDHNLITRIRHESEAATNSGSSWFGLRVFATAVGVLLVALSILAYLTISGSPETKSYMIAGFAEDSLINVASGDHEHCAVKHDLAEFPVVLADAPPEYRGLDKLVEQGLGSSLADHKLVEAHACKFSNVRFAHFVMKGDGNIVSVLIAPDRQNGDAVDQRIRGYSSAAYDVTTFGAAGQRVFVIAEHGSEMDRKAAESLARPLEKHFLSWEYPRTAGILRSPGTGRIYLITTSRPAPVAEVTF